MNLHVQATPRIANHSYWKRPSFQRYFDGGCICLGPIQFNWGYGNGQMPKGLRVHLTWPGRTRSLYIG